MVDATLAHNLRSIAERMTLAPLGRIAQEPGVRAAYRLTVQYHDGRACDSVATLRRAGPDDALLEVVFRGALQQKPLTHAMDLTRFQVFTHTFQTVRFDTLPDQPNLPYHSADLWLVERAAGGFYKSVLIAPQQANGPYAALVQAVQTHLPEALREVKWRGL